MRKIIHIDMDMFFVAVEIRDRPELAELPVAIGGPREGRGVLSTANYIARQFGVHSAMPTGEALKKCPNLVLLRGDMGKYKAESQKIFQVFESVTSKVEGLSLDEAFLDVSDCSLCGGSATRIAMQIKESIFRETGLTASAGVAPNKFLAKVASDFRKPDGLTVVTPEEVDAFVRDLPVKKIFGVGKVLGEKLHSQGIHFCRDLQGFSKAELYQRFGQVGGRLFEYARGVDERPVQTDRKRKSVSVERTYEVDLVTEAQVEENIQKLYKVFLERWKAWCLKNRDLKFEVASLRVKVRFQGFSTTTVERHEEGLEIEHFRSLIWEGIQRERKAIRLLGLGVSLRYPKENLQLDLFKDGPQ